MQSHNKTTVVLSNVNNAAQASFWRGYKRFWPFMRKYLFWSVFGMLLTIPIGALDAVVTSFLRPFMDRVMVEQDKAFAYDVPLYILGFALGQGILLYVSSLVNSYVGGRIGRDMKQMLFKKLLGMDTAFYDRNNTGTINFRYASDVDTASSALMDNLKLFLTKFFSSLSLIGVLLYNSWQLSIAALGMLVLLIIPMAKVRRRIKKITNDSVRVGTQVVTLYNETTDGARIIKSFNLIGYMNKRFDNVVQYIFKLNMKLIRDTNWLPPVMHLVTAIGVALVLYFGMTLILDKVITPGAFVAFLSALIMLYTPIKSIGKNYINVQKALLAIDRIYQLLEIDSYESEEIDDLLDNGECLSSNEKKKPLNTDQNEIQESINDVSSRSSKNCTDKHSHSSELENLQSKADVDSAIPLEDVIAESYGSTNAQKLEPQNNDSNEEVHLMGDNDIFISATKSDKTSLLTGTDELVKQTLIADVDQTQANSSSKLKCSTDKDKSTAKELNKALNAAPLNKTNALKLPSSERCIAKSTTQMAGTKLSKLHLADIKDNITFSHVFFRYLNDGPWILNDISFSVKAGSKVALVGNSGGGKSTVCSLIPRLYEINDGVISIDGHDIKDYSLASLRANMAMVFQDNFLFEGTFKENLLMGKQNATSDEIESALKSAYLEEVVSKLNNGIDEPIGERGMLLSGGQKQRLAIARTIIKNAPLVILDEATSALDNKSERIVQKALDKLMHGKTTIVIAHRLSTIMDADKILVINDGQIVEQGTHTELLAMNGAYATLYRAQFSKNKNSD